VADEIKLVYELADDMSSTFDAGAEQLQDTMQEMQSIASQLEDGALLGRAGQAFVEAIRSRLCPSIGKLTDKFQELNQDVQAAKKAMQEADKTSKGLLS
jgi:WXG100 family type VII secretion target